MDDLIEALSIFRKYTDSYNPTHCEHDVLIVPIDPSSVSQDDINRLEQLDFMVEEEHFYSFRFGAA